MINTDDMFEPIKRAIRECEEALYQESRHTRELEHTLSKASMFEGDIRTVLAQVTCPCCGALRDAEHASKCSIGMVLRCRY